MIPRRSSLKAHPCSLLWNFSGSHGRISHVPQTKDRDTTQTNRAVDKQSDSPPRTSIGPMKKTPNLILANLFGLSINNLTSAIAQTAAHKCASAAQACASAALYDTPYADQIAETWGETATKFAQLSATYADLAVTHARKVASSCQ